MALSLVVLLFFDSYKLSFADAAVCFFLMKKLTAEDKITYYILESLFVLLITF